MQRLAQLHRTPLIAEAINSWGIRDLELVATPTGLIAHKPPAYSFPPGTSISAKPAESRLQCLKLTNCLPPSLEGLTALTTLVLQGLPKSTPDRACRLLSCKFCTSSPAAIP